MTKVRLAILRNEVEDDHVMWLRACTELTDRVMFQVIDITRSDWLQRVREGRFDGLLASPSGWSTTFKTLYDERVTILADELGMPVYPTLREIRIYENKKYLSYWLEANAIPHARTWVFYHEEEAIEHLAGATYPLVAKTSVGGGGDGVRILEDRDTAAQYVRRTFSGAGASRTVGPKWRRRGFLRRALQRLLHPRSLMARIGQYRMLRSEVQKDLVILQEYVPHDHEWRAVRIGDSYFAHKKLKKGEFASGSLLKEYGAPPLQLLDLVRSITDAHGFRSQAVDLFGSPSGGFLVNEMQCIFGQSDPHQMLVNGIPGRYVHVDGSWVFEPGDFNRHESFLLRLQDFLSILSSGAAGRTTDPAGTA